MRRHNRVYSTCADIKAGASYIIRHTKIPHAVRRRPAETEVSTQVSDGFDIFISQVRPRNLHLEPRSTATFSPRQKIQDFRPPDFQDRYGCQQPNPEIHMKQKLSGKAKFVIQVGAHTSQAWGQFRSETGFECAAVEHGAHCTVSII